MFSVVNTTTTTKSLQSCPTLCDPRDGSPPGSPVLGILWARILEWVAISFSNAWKWKVKGKSLSRVQLLATPWTTAYQAPPSMGFSRQDCWSGVPLPSPSVMNSYQYFSRRKYSVIDSMFHLRITRNFARIFVSVFLHTIVFTLVVGSRKYQCHVIFNTYQHKFYAISLKILFYILIYYIKENTLNKKYW